MMQHILFLQLFVLSMISTICLWLARPQPNFRVDADKGFNFSQPDDSFVCQKKNHFQVTVHMQVSGDARYVTTPEGVKKIDAFFLHFNGVKVQQIFTTKETFKKHIFSVKDIKICRLIL